MFRTIFLKENKYSHSLEKQQVERYKLLKNGLLFTGSIAQAEY